MNPKYDNLNIDTQNNPVVSIDKASEAPIQENIPKFSKNKLIISYVILMIVLLVVGLSGYYWINNL